MRLTSVTTCEVSAGFIERVSGVNCAKRGEAHAEASSPPSTPERGMADFGPPAPESLARRPLARRIVALQRAYELVSSVDSPEWDLAALREVLRLAGGVFLPLVYI